MDNIIIDHYLRQNKYTENTVKEQYLYGPESTDFIDEIDGIIIDNKYNRTAENGNDIYMGTLRGAKLFKQFDFDKTFEENLVNKYPNIVKRYGNEKNFDMLCSRLATLYTDVEDNEKILKTRTSLTSTSAFSKIYFDNLKSYIKVSKTLRIPFLKKIITYSLANRNYHTMIRKKDKILHVVNIIQQNLREIYGIDNINVTLALCEYITQKFSTAPLGTFQYLLKIYCNESTLSEYVIISGEDYPYTVTSVYYGDDPDIMNNVSYNTSHNETEKIISLLYKNDNKLKHTNANIFGNNNTEIKNESEWKKKIRCLTCHVHICYKSNDFLVKHIQQLQNEIMELKLRPGGDEYNKIKTHFESLQPLLSHNMNSEQNTK